MESVLCAYTFLWARECLQHSLDLWLSPWWIQKICRISNGKEYNFFLRGDFCLYKESANNQGRSLRVDLGTCPYIGQIFKINSVHHQYYRHTWLWLLCIGLLFFSPSYASRRWQNWESLCEALSQNLMHFKISLLFWNSFKNMKFLISYMQINLYNLFRKKQKFSVFCLNVMNLMFWTDTFLYFINLNFSSWVGKSWSKSSVL